MTTSSPEPVTLGPPRLRREGTARVALVHLVNWWQKDLVVDDVFAPIGSAHLAAALRAAGFEAETETHRFDLDRPGLPRVLDGDLPLYIGISATGNELEALWALSDRVRAAFPSVPIVAGGYCSLAGDELFSTGSIDVMAHGEGEATAVDLARAYATGSPLDGVLGITYRRGDGTLAHTPSRPQPDDLDLLPLPTYRHEPAEGRSIRVYASRGCPYECSYCEIKDFYGRTKRVRRHGTGYIGALVDGLIAAAPGPIELVRFNDDEFLLHADHLAQMAEVVRPRGLKMTFQTRARDVVRHRDTIEANRDVIAEIHIGIESFSAAQLERWHKGTSPETNQQALAVLAELGVTSYPYMILTDAHTTPDELEESCAGLLAAAAGPVPVEVDGQLHQLLLRPVQRNMAPNRMKTFRGGLDRRPETAWLDDLWHFLLTTAPVAGYLAQAAGLDLTRRPSAADAAPISGDGHPLIGLIEQRIAILGDLARRLVPLDPEARRDLAQLQASQFEQEARWMILTHLAKAAAGQPAGAGSPEPNRASLR